MCITAQTSPIMVVTRCREKKRLLIQEWEKDMILF